MKSQTEKRLSQLPLLPQKRKKESLNLTVGVLNRNQNTTSPQLPILYKILTSPSPGMNGNPSNSTKKQPNAWKQFLKIKPKTVNKSKLKTKTSKINTSSKPIKKQISSISPWLNLIYISTKRKNFSKKHTTTTSFSNKEYKDIRQFFHL